MRRILGKDISGQWHLTCSTFSGTMHTLCNKWLRATDFIVEGEGHAIVPDHCPWCVVCVFVFARYTAERLKH